MMRVSTRPRLAPRLVAASSTSTSRSSITGCSVRTTNGSPMKTSATVMPSGVNATLMPWASSGLPIHPFGAYSVVRVMPATAVGSANGRSISASTIRLPGKS